MRRRNSYLTAGLILAGLTAALILLSFFWTPCDPNAMSADRSGPSLAHLMGTDNFGRDILSRVMKGAGATASIALATVAIGAVCGTAIGALTGYFGGFGDVLPVVEKSPMGRQCRNYPRWGHSLDLAGKCRSSLLGSIRSFSGGAKDSSPRTRLGC